MSPTFTLASSPEMLQDLSQLRNLSLKPAEVRKLVGEMASKISKLVVKDAPADGEKIAIIVVLRSGLAMMEPFLQAFPETADTVIYHLGLYREKETLCPVEYYNKLPIKDSRIKTAYILDPLIATGGTARAAIRIIRDWGVDHIKFVSLLGSEKGLQDAATEWPEGAEIFTSAVDKDLDSKGYVKPGLGDIGDRLYGTV